MTAISSNNDPLLGAELSVEALYSTPVHILSLAKTLVSMLGLIFIGSSLLLLPFPMSSKLLDELGCLAGLSSGMLSWPRLLAWLTLPGNIGSPDSSLSLESAFRGVGMSELLTVLCSLAISSPGFDSRLESVSGGKAANPWASLLAAADVSAVACLDPLSHSSELSPSHTPGLSVLGAASAASAEEAVACSLCFWVVSESCMQTQAQSMPTTLTYHTGS